MSQNRYEQLREKARREYEARLEAITWMQDQEDSLETPEVHAPGATPSQNGSARSILPGVESHIDLDQLDHDCRDRPRLIEAVGEIFERHPDRDWTTAKIFRYLTLSDFPLPGKAPKSSISTSIARLIKKGDVEMLLQGKGRGSNVYRKSRAQAEAVSEEPVPTPKPKPASPTRTGMTEEGTKDNLPF